MKIATTYASNSPKWIMPNISLNIKSKWMKGDQVRKNNKKQIISIAMWTLKWFQKNSTTWIIKYRFVWHIIYKQNVPNMSIEKSQEENIKVFMKYKLFKVSSKKMIIFWAQLLSENPWRIQINMCLLFSFIQIFFDVIMSCFRPNIQIVNWTK